MKQEAKILIEKYNSGTLSSSEETQLEKFIEEGIIELDMLEDISELSHKLSYYFSETISREMRQEFRQMLEAEKSNHNSGFNLIQQIRNFLFPQNTNSLVYMLGLLLIGLIAGLSLHSSFNNSNNAELNQMASDLQDMREMMMLSLLEEQSTSDRLKAVSLTSEMTDVSDKIATALLNTLNKDPNINVRLYALDALYDYADNPKVRTGLIQSISHQESPIVQVALAEIMEALQDKSAIAPLKKLLDKEQTPTEVKEQIEHSISTLL